MGYWKQGEKLQIASSISRFFFVGTEEISKQNYSSVNGIYFHKAYSNLIIYDNEERRSYADLGEKNRIIEILLRKALPVPSDNVSVENILEFKRKRFEELLNFRHAMEGLYLQISKSDFMMDEINHRIDTIDSSLRDIRRVMNEGKLRSNLSTLISNIKINDVVLGAIAGKKLFDPYDLPLLGAFLGATIVS